MLPEVKDYLDRIDDLRTQVRSLVADLPADALNWRPVEESEEHSMNSLAVLAMHVAGAEHFWIGEVVGGLPATRVRDQEFVTAVEDAQPLLEQLDAVATQTQAVLDTITAADLETIHSVGRFTVSSRWGILHVIDHSALHLGHMQITYQLWNHGKGVDAPRWFERV